jgi:hypothetical protein
MAFCDFVVKYDEEKDTGEELTKRILYSVIIKRLKANKPAVCFVGGDSGEGKSYSVLRLLELLFEVQGRDLKDYFDAVNIFTPLEYPQKLEKILFDKKYKKANLIVIHEAREIVKAKLWHSFVTQAVADVNAMSRSIKRLGTFIISQFIRDITNDIRYTLNFYMIVRRPKRMRARLYLYVMWKDDRNLEKPILRKRKLSGYLVDPAGRYRRYIPEYLELKKPDKETIAIFEKLEYDAKAGIIKSKLTKLMAEMQADIGKQTKKVEAMVLWYIKHPDNLTLIGKRLRGKWKLKSEVQEMHDLTRDETERFEQLLNEELVKKGIIPDGGSPDKFDINDLNEDEGDAQDVGQDTATEE